MQGFWTVFLSALAVRLLYLFQIRGTPITAVLLIDSETYDRFARLILSGTFRGEEVYTMNLLYPYFLAGIYALTGAAPFAALIVQAVLGALNVGLIYALGRRLFDPPTAWVAGLTAALYAPYVFYTGALLTPTLIDTFALLALLLLAMWRTSRHAALLVTAGVCTGFAALGRGSALLLVALFPLFARIESGSWRRVLRPSGLFAGCALLLPALATVRNGMVAGEFVPVSANYAAFYVGHQPRANGLYVMPEFARTAAFQGEVTGVRKALSQELGRELSQAEASQELFRRGVAWARSHPGQELSLAARKLYYFWNRAESPTNLSFDCARAYSGLLRALPLHFGVIAPLGLAGMVGAWRRWRQHALLYAALLVPFLTCLIFFVSGEYRLPAAAVLVLFGAHAAVRGAARLAAWAFPSHAAEGRAGRRRERKEARSASKPQSALALGSHRDAWVALALLPVLAFACNVRTPLLLAQSMNYVAFFNYGQVYKHRGQLDQAEALLMRSLAVAPGYAPALMAMADLENRRGHSTEAIRYAEEARRIDPTIAPEARPPSPDEPVWASAERLYQQGRYEEALAAFERARRQSDSLGRGGEASAMANNVALALFQLKRYDQAEKVLREIIRTDPTYVRAHGNLAQVLEAEGRIQDALAEYRRALQLEPGDRRARAGVERLGGPSR